MSVVTDSRVQTGLGNYFVANYPPFSAWKPEHVPTALAALDRAPRADTPLGLYLHIPFCRKRCKFCYFRVYTDKNADDVTTYSNALIREVELYSQRSCVGNRPLEFVYFGGGTPSYLSANQLRTLMTRLQEIMSWTQAKEVTFECEPGTLQLHKLQALKELGVTRLSLGIENFNDEILECNGRAHLSAEIHRAYDWARQCGFDQINIDLIAGMVGETWDNWRDCVAKTVALAPESITVYAMELPYNTEFSKSLTVINPEEPALEIADWPTKRAWVAYAFEQFFANGYERSSAYTAVRSAPGRGTKFVYRDSLWHGADMFGTGVASFGHVNGVHMQNLDRWDDYLKALLGKNELPLHRALRVSDQELMTRELILQLKTGRIELEYFRAKYSRDIRRDFAKELDVLSAQNVLTVNHDVVALTDLGFREVDRYLPTFFDLAYETSRYA